MAKHRGGMRDDEREPTPADFEVPAGAAEPAGGQASVAGDTPEGTTVYPPPASDQSGERTANVPPAKQLPTRAPDAGPDEGAALRAENAAMRQALSSLGVNAAEIARQAGEQFRAENAAESAGPTSKARVTFPGMGIEDTVVEYPADTPEEGRKAAAIKAAGVRHGITSFPTQPEVHFDVHEDEESPRAKTRRKGG